MFVVKRNQVIVTALVVMVGVAGYLNFQENKLAQSSRDMVFSDDTDLTGFLVSNDLTDTAIDTVDGEISIALSDDDALVARLNGDDTDGEVIPVAGDNQSEEPGQAVFVNTSTDASYFVQAKLDREQARAKRKEILMEMLENQNIEKEQKAECADAILELQKRIEKETSAEAMIEAKGFSNAYVRIDDETVDVVVDKEALSEAEIAQIEDIVKRKTGFEADKIRISPLKQ